MAASRTILAILAAYLMAAFTLSACNTTEGFGRDVQSTGDAIEDAAD